MKLRVHDIVVPNDRFRTEVEGIEELAESLRDVGLIHPIVVRREGRAWVLVAGFRRLTAAKLLGWQEIEARSFEELDELSRRLVEFEENVRRQALSWQDEVRAAAEIRRLRGDIPLSAASEELGVAKGRLAEDLQLARALDWLPPESVRRVASHPTRAGAIKTMKREVERVLIAELSRRRAATASEELGDGSLVCGDAAVVLAGVEADSVGLVITDPPWLTSSKLQQSDFGFSGRTPDELREVYAQCLRVLVPGGHLYTFVDADNLSGWWEMLSEAGFMVRRRPLIWVRGHIVVDPQTNFMTCYDAALWAAKPPVPRPFGTAIADAVSMPKPKSWHESAKPPELLEAWIEASSSPGELVLDPFAGSGQTLIAARRRGRRFLGIEIDRRTFDACLSDLRALHTHSSQS